MTAGRIGRILEEVEWLRKARGPLVKRPVLDIARVLGLVGSRFLVADDPLRKEALDRIPGESGLSRPMVRHILDGMARDWLPDRLTRLLREEFDTPELLDRFIRDGSRREPTAGDERPPSDRRLRVMGDPVALHIGAGSVPGVCTTSAIRSLLVKSPVLVKPGAGDRALAELYARGLQEADAELANAIRVVYWEGGDAALEESLFASVGRVVVYGSDHTVRSVRDRVPVHVPVVIYHHRSSVAVVGPEALEGEALGETAEELAWAASTFDQRGCVSPHRVWVLGSNDDALRLGRATARAMERVHGTIPSGERSDAERSRIHQLREGIEMRAAAGEPVQVWKSAGTEWTVVVESALEIRAAGAPRALVISACGDSGELFTALQSDGPHLQTVGIAGLGQWGPRVADALSSVGATRLVPLDAVTFPPAWWHHDGQGPLRTLVRWVEWES